MQNYIGRICSGHEIYILVLPTTHNNNFLPKNDYFRNLILSFFYSGLHEILTFSENHRNNFVRLKLLHIDQLANFPTEISVPGHIWVMTIFVTFTKFDWNFGFARNLEAKISGEL